MIDFITSDRRIGIYETAAGEHGIVRYATVTEQEEIPGFAPAVSRREIAEAVFVSRDDEPRASQVLAENPGTACIGDLLALENIDFRLPASVGTDISRRRAGRVGEAQTATARAAA